MGAVLGQIVHYRGAGGCQAAIVAAVIPGSLSGSAVLLVLDGLAHGTCWDTVPQVAGGGPGTWHEGGDCDGTAREMRGAR